MAKRKITYKVKVMRAIAGTADWANFSAWSECSESEEDAVLKDLAAWIRKLPN